MGFNFFRSYLRSLLIAGLVLAEGGEALFAQGAAASQEEMSDAEAAQELRPHFEVTQTDENHLQVRMETDRWVAVSVCGEHIPDIQRLFADPEVMRRFGNGQPRDPELTAARVRNVWIPRWQRGDPRSALVVLAKEAAATSEAGESGSESNVAGLVIAGAGSISGESEICYLLFKSHQGRGLGTEIVSAMVRVYVPWMQGFFPNGFGGESLRKLVATSSSDNTASLKILDGLGFTHAYPDLELVADFSQSDQEDEAAFLQHLDESRRVNYRDHQGRVRTVERVARWGGCKWHFCLDLGCIGAAL